MNTYEEKYKHALENFKKIKSANSDNKELVNFIEYEYPELRESEDERIKKELIQYLKDYPNLPNGHYCCNDFFAWLEKQGEQKLEWSEDDERDIDNIIWLCDNIEKGIENTWIPSQAKRIKDLMNRIKSLKLKHQKECITLKLNNYGR